MFGFFKKDPVYVVRDLDKNYIMYPGCLEQHGYNVGPDLRKAKRCHTLNRARKDGKYWFLHSGYDICELKFFNMFAKVIEHYEGV